MGTDSFFNRWSKRKLGEERLNTEAEPAIEVAAPEAVASSTFADPNPSELGKETLPNAEPPSVDPDEASGKETLSSLLVSTASQEIKKAALRDLFFNGEFNELDRLDDYDGDYQDLKPITSEVSQTLRHWLNDINEEAESTWEQISHSEPALEQPENHQTHGVQAEEIGSYPDEDKINT